MFQCQKLPVCPILIYTLIIYTLIYILIYTLITYTLSINILTVRPTPKPQPICPRAIMAGSPALSNNSFSIYSLKVLMMVGMMEFLAALVHRTSDRARIPAILSEVPCSWAAAQQSFPCLQASTLLCLMPLMTKFPCRPMATVVPWIPLSLGTWTLDLQRKCK